MKLQLMGLTLDVPGLWPGDSRLVELAAMPKPDAPTIEELTDPTANGLAPGVYVAKLKTEAGVAEVTLRLGGQAGGTNDDFALEGGQECVIVIDESRRGWRVYAANYNLAAAHVRLTAFTGQTV